MYELLRPIWITLVKWGAIVGGILLILFKVRQSGKDIVRNENIKETLDGVEARDKVEDHIVASSDLERRRLRKKWTR